MTERIADGDVGSECHHDPVIAPYRRRWSGLLALLVTVAAGLLVQRTLPASPVTDIAGDALYTVAVYAGLVSLFPTLAPRIVALLAGAWSVAVELFQVTGIPVELARRFPPVALVLGTGFNARDLVVYVVAAGAALAVDLRLTHRALRHRTVSGRSISR